MTSRTKRKSLLSPDLCLKREEYNGHDWPADSPVSRSYDVGNTSTKLIILNNKYGQNGTRLRGYYTGPKKPDRMVNPDRHRAKSPRDPRYHEACLDSSSPKFEPTVKTDLDWLGSSVRPPNALIVKTSVNPHRHASCRSSPEINSYGGRPHSRISLPAKYLYNSEYADMTIGEKIYLWSIEKIYNVEKMKKLKQEQYHKLLDGEAKKGYHSRGEMARYRRYISSASDRSYGTGTGPNRRAKSAYTHRTHTSQGRTSTAKSDNKSPAKENEQSERPKTSMGTTRKEKRDSSRSPDRSSNQRSASVGSEDRKPSSSESDKKKSPGSSRKSSARSQRSNISSRSKSSSRVPSRTSLRSSDRSKQEKTDSDQVTTDNEQPRHKEGRDRPKSRLGHPGGADDRDKVSIHSSVSSIKSDNNGSSSSDSSSDNKQKREKKVSQQQQPISSSRVNSANKDTKPKSDSEANQRRSSEISKTGSMGSRASVGSKTSKTSDKGRNNSNGQTGGSTTGENKDTNSDKVHKIPSASYIEDEVNAKEKDDTNKRKNGTDQAKDKEEDKGDPVDKINEGYKTQIEIDENKDSTKSIENQKNGTIKGDNDDDKRDNEVKDENGKELKSESAGINNKTDNDKVEDSKDLKGDDLENGKVDDENVKGGNSGEEIKEKSNEKGEEVSDDETVVKDDAGNNQNTENGKTRNVLSRQDSFDDDDDDRKVNKDLDKIEY
ncbi:hypothetical protein ACF0H5_016737 [Mactra antiquata]